MITTPAIMIDHANDDHLTGFGQLLGVKENFCATNSSDAPIIPNPDRKSHM
jgi:hypothetical protein